MLTIQKYGAKIKELIGKGFYVEVIPENIYITTKKNLIILELKLILKMKDYHLNKLHYHLFANTG